MLARYRLIRLAEAMEAAAGPSFGPEDRGSVGDPGGRVFVHIASILASQRAQGTRSRSIDVRRQKSLQLSLLERLARHDGSLKSSLSIAPGLLLVNIERRLRKLGSLRSVLGYQVG